MAVLIFVISDGPLGLVILLFSGIAIVLSFVSFLLSGSNISYDVKISEHIVSDTNKRLKIEFIQRTASFFPVFSSKAFFQIENITTGEICTGEIFEKEILELEASYCGFVEVVVDKIIVYDFLNLFKKTIDTRNVHGVLISPNFKNIEIDAERFDSYDLESYEFSYLKKGDDPSEIFGLKEYEPGDNMKSIHWKLSGKLDELIIKEAGFPIDNKTMLLLNNSMVNEDLLSPEKRSNLIEMYVSIAKVLLDEGLKHTMGWYDYNHNHFMSVSIDEINDVWNSIPDILKSGYRPDDISMPLHFIEEIDDVHYANYIYVTEHDRRDVERLEELGEVSIFTTADFK